MNESRIALVTGASSGIGRASAIRLARSGYLIVLAARNAERMDEVARTIRADGGTAVTRVVDVTDTVQAEALVAWVEATYGRLDLLINAAGVMSVGPSLDVSIEEWKAMIDTNVTALIVLCKLVLPLMLRTAPACERGVVDIVNISSLAGRSSKAEHNVYNATKWAVIGFSGALRQEFAHQGIRVSIIEPGLTATDIFAKQPTPAREYFKKITTDKQILDADDVAQLIEFVVTRPRHVAVSESVIHPAAQA